MDTENKVSNEENVLTEFENEAPKKNKLHLIYKLIIGIVLVLIGISLNGSYFSYAMIMWGGYRVITTIKKIIFS
jgi:hypothetical protein